MRSAIKKKCAHNRSSDDFTSYRWPHHWQFSILVLDRNTIWNFIFEICERKIQIFYMAVRALFILMTKKKKALNSFAYDNGHAWLYGVWLFFWFCSNGKLHFSVSLFDHHRWKCSSKWLTEKNWNPRNFRFFHLKRLSRRKKVLKFFYICFHQIRNIFLSNNNIWHMEIARDSFSTFF